MNPTEALVEKAIAEKGITDADEKPITPPADKPKDDDKKDDTKKDDKVEEKKPEAPKYDKDGNRVKEEDKSDETDKKDEKKDTEDDKGFTADDALEVEDTKAPQAPPTDSSGVVLSSAEQKFVVDNIGEPLIIRGMRGTGDDAKEVELKVFDPTQIPRDFTFGSQSDLLAAQQGFSRLEQKAQTLLGNFRQQQSQTQANDFETRENEGIRQDVAELQKDGAFPKFKIQPGQKGFDDDPAAKEMATVLDVMTKTNNQYMQEYQQGRPYKHIGFREAFDTYQKSQGTKDKEVEQKHEDDERKQIADKVGTSRGMTASKIMKPTVRHGTTTRDILNRIELEEF